MIEGTSGELDQRCRSSRPGDARLDPRLALVSGRQLDRIDKRRQPLRRSGLSPRRARNSSDKEYTSEGERFLGFPIVVLVNGDTSGGAELIAAALQDHHRATVVGQRTRGKASIQTLIPLPAPDTGLKLTSAMFIRPNGKSLHRFPESKRRRRLGRPARAGTILPDLPRPKQAVAGLVANCNRSGPHLATKPFRLIIPLPTPSGNTPCG